MSYSGAPHPWSSDVQWHICSADEYDKSFVFFSICLIVINVNCQSDMDVVIMLSVCRSKCASRLRDNTANWIPSRKFVSGIDRLPLFIKMMLLP